MFNILPIRSLFNNQWKPSHNNAQLLLGYNPCISVSTISTTRGQPLHSNAGLIKILAHHGHLINDGETWLMSSRDAFWVCVSDQCRIWLQDSSCCDRRSAHSVQCEYQPDWFSCQRTKRGISVNNTTFIYIFYFSFI